MLRLRVVRSLGARSVHTAAGLLHFDPSRGLTACVPELLAEELVAEGLASLPTPAELCPGEWLVRRRAGLGDCLCLAAMLRELVAQGGRVAVTCHPLYAPLFQGLPIGEADPKHATPVVFDGWLERHPGRKGRSAARCMGDRWNLDLQDARPWYMLRDEERSWGQEQVARWRQGGAPVVALFERAGWSTRTYREWRRVAHELARQGVSILLFDGEPLPCCRKPDGPYSVRELAAVLAAVDVVLSGDSGPMHLAQAVGTPAVSVFGCTGAAGSVAPGYAVTALEPEGLDCWPCWSGGCLVGEEDVPGGCVRAVDPARVVEATLARVRPAHSQSEVTNHEG